MAKRFIDTGLFEDPWFSDLTPNAKLFWVYYLTRCDNAGCMKYNERLMVFQTGIKSIPTVIQELGNRLLRVNQELLFCPKFLEFQYPGFPNSKAPQQIGAQQILIKNGILNSDLTFKSYPTVSLELSNSNGNGNGKGDGNDNGNIGAKSEFEKTLSFFYEMRNKIRKPATDRAKELILIKLNKLAPNDTDKQIEILEQSIQKSWQDVFELKSDYKPTKNTDFYKVPEKYGKPTQ